MKPSSFYKLFTVTLCALVCAIALWVTAPTYQLDKEFGKKFIPNLMDKINNIVVMSIEHAGKTITFERDNAGNWSLIEAANYPADKERIRKVLIGLANLEKIEPKTALPEYYKDLGVQDNTAETTESFLLTLMGKDGQEITQLLVGKRIAGFRWDGQGYFVRNPRQKQSWLVRGSMDVTGDMRSWLNARLFPINESNISAVTFVNQSKTREFVFRRNSEDEKLEPIFGTDFHFLKSEKFIDGMVNALATLEFTNVGHRPANLAQLEPYASLFIETDNAMNIFLFLYLLEDKPYVAVTFGAEPNATEQEKALVEQLKARHSKWLYQISAESTGEILPFLSVPDKKSNLSTKKSPVKKSSVKKSSAKKSSVKKGSAKKTAKRTKKK